jgi:hypothetical protein
MIMHSDGDPVPERQAQHDVEGALDVVVDSRNRMSEPANHVLNSSEAQTLPAWSQAAGTAGSALGQPLEARDHRQ